MATIENIVGSAQPTHFIKQRRRSILIDFFLSTSTHGLRSVGRAYSVLNRIMWIIIFTIAFGFLLYFVITAICQYFSYPTQTTIEIRFDRTMPFPAVTVCSGNAFRYDKLNASLVKYFYRLNPANTTYTQNILNQLVFPLFADLLNRNQTDEIRSIGFQLQDMLLACSYNGINCSDGFVHSFSSVFGNCFTFNWKTSTKLLTLADFSNSLVPYEGLTMTFYVPRESFLPNMLYDIGLVVLIHNNNELPVPNENGLPLQPGLSHSISYRKSETVFLPSPYTTCTSKVGDDLNALYQTTFTNYDPSTNVAYSQSICEELCTQGYVFSQCSCILPMPFLTRQVLTLDGNLTNANCCSFLNTEATSCAFTAQQQFANNDQLHTLWCSHCTSQCNNTSFATDISAMLGPNDAEKAYWAGILLNGSNTSTILVPDDFSSNFSYYFDRNFLKVHVGYSSKYVTVYKQEAKLALVDTFAAIGGQTGLWMGVSILSVIELTELIYRLIRKRVALWKNKQIIPTIQVKPRINK